MTARWEEQLRVCLREIRPRDGFAAELLAALTHDAVALYAVGDTLRGSRSRWVVAGALAGVVTATGAVYLAARRHQGGAA